MLNIPCRLPMPDKEQGSFRTSLCTFTFRHIPLPIPKLESPAAKAPGDIQINPQDKKPASYNAAQPFQVGSYLHRFTWSQAFLRPAHVVHESGVLDRKAHV